MKSQLQMLALLWLPLAAAKVCAQADGKLLVVGPSAGASNTITAPANTNRVVGVSPIGLLDTRTDSERTNITVSIVSPFNDISIAQEWGKMEAILHEHAASPAGCLSSLYATYFWTDEAKANIALGLITNAAAKGLVDTKKLQLEIHREGQEPKKPNKVSEATSGSAPGAPPEAPQD